ncbi:hypothetical protein TNCV_4990991 [Trichonephila clavipes]|nr:hypothetical protein TNCV_4990991 [Trichonephila clavipes]
MTDTARQRSSVKKKFCKKSYTRAFGDGQRNFEPWSSDVDDTLASTPCPNSHTTPTGGCMSSQQRFSTETMSSQHVYRSSTRWVFSGTGLEVMRPATIQYLGHSATAAS